MTKKFWVKNYKDRCWHYVLVSDDEKRVLKVIKKGKRF